MLAAIEVDLASCGRGVLILLGDYVDRGPDSRDVIETVARLQDAAAFEVRCLRGNHEDRMQAFLGDATLGPGWCDYGGRECLLSYGVQPPVRRDDAEGWEACRAAFQAALPPRHLRFLSGLLPATEVGDYFFAHAGARPGVPLHSQSTDDLMWIRQDFLAHRGRFERIVVHGHTPGDLHADHRRIGLDTGAYATGVLTAVRLEGTNRSALQARIIAGRAVMSEVTLA